MRSRLRQLHRRLLGRDQIDRLEAQAAETQQVALSANHLAAVLHDELRQVRELLHQVAHQTHHLHDVVLPDVAELLAATEVSLAAVVRQAASIDPPEAAPDGPLVTVVMATWERAHLITAALESLQQQTYPRWECIVVDDGSDDGTDAVVAPFLEDDRICYERIEHVGAPAARNHGLDLARGEVVAYLDTDNTWHPTHLARVIQALAERPKAEWVLSGQLVVDHRTGSASVRNDLRPLEALVDANHCDLNAMAHRRDTLTEIGPFDPTLLRMSDWDLALRLAARGAPARVDAVTSIYRASEDNRITDVVPGHHFAHVIRARHRGLPAAGLRVLLAEWHYPQITETYIGTLINGLTALGADVQVWSQDDVAVAYPSPVPMHRGDLDETLQAVQPHIVVTHWLSKGVELRPVTRARGLPHVVRTHGFEYVPDTVAELLADPGALVHTFPHLVDPAWASHPRLDVTVTFFDDGRYRPSPAKDRRLVVRTAAGLLTKDLETFLMAADLCPNHRFVLVLGHSKYVEERTEAMIARRDELGSPAEVQVDLQHDEVAALISQAGIYLHTHGTDHPVSMPISIAEAMATGCWVLGRELPGMVGYVGRAGTLYGGDTSAERAAAAAALIRGSLAWDEDRWAAQAAASVDQAFERYASRDVVEQMLRSWRRAFALPPRTDR